MRRARGREGGLTYYIPARECRFTERKLCVSIALPQCLGKDSLRRGHFSGVWMGEQCVDRQRSKGKGIPGKARTPSSWYLATACSVFLEQGACVFGGHGARRES